MMSVYELRVCMFVTDEGPERYVISQQYVISVQWSCMLHDSWTPLHLHSSSPAGYGGPVPSTNGSMLSQLVEMHSIP
jgi:hypothetical protein